MDPYHSIKNIFTRDPDTNRAQIGSYSLPAFAYLKDSEWVFEEKVDGTNIRVIWDGERVTFNGRTNNAQMPAPLVTRLQDTFTSPCRRGYLETSFPTGVTLYGEGYGNKIQKTGYRYNPNGVDFILFDVKVGDTFLDREAVTDIATRLGIKRVPEVGRGPLEYGVMLVQSGFVSWLIDGPVVAEGLIARPAVRLLDHRGGRIICKIKARDLYEAA
jgi:ATP-dependent RNA circularization protein (DNA/RNA ligase family)